MEYRMSTGKVCVTLRCTPPPQLTVGFLTECTFCEKLRAVFHCPDCKDFYCIACDKTTHSHGKRKGHVRSQLSLYSMNDASRRCTYLVRYSYLLRKIQRLTRLKVRQCLDTFRCLYLTLCFFAVFSVQKVFRQGDSLSLLREHRLQLHLLGEAPVPAPRGAVPLHGAGAGRDHHAGATEDEEGEG